MAAPVDSYFELHIEQGPELEAMGITIGAVTHSHYSISADIECRGDNGHIQSLPMLRRRNALVGAARLIAEIDRIGRAAAPAGSASAVVIDAWPNNRINIPHRAVFSYGVIHPDAEGLERMQARDRCGNPDGRRMKPVWNSPRSSRAGAIRCISPKS